MNILVGDHVVVKTDNQALKRGTRPFPTWKIYHCLSRLFLLGYVAPAFGCGGSIEEVADGGRCNIHLLCELASGRVGVIDDAGACVNDHEYPACLWEGD